jgi:flagellar biosynthesis anti-sigma factor FlgM
MKISNLFGRTEQLQQSKVRDQDAAAAQGKKSAQQSASEDVVSLSPLSRQLSQLSSIMRDEDTARAKKIENIKARIGDGSYDISNEDVAKSIVAYARDSEFDA